MKHYYLILTSALLLAASHAKAVLNSDPAAGAQPAPAAKVAPRPVKVAPAVKVEAPAKPAVTSAVAAPAPVAAPPARPAAKAESKKDEVKKDEAKKAKAAVKEEKPQAESKPAPGSLEAQLQSLDAGNKLPVAANHEKLYAVQQRYLPLRWKSEITFGGASNMTGDNFVRTQQLEAGYRLHINDRWGLGLQYASVENKLNSEVEGLKTNGGALPVVPYAISRTDLTLEYNAFYGKFRWTAETVSYFDLYVALGAAQIEQNTGTSTGYVGDLGLVAWIGRWGSARAGLKDYYYQEKYTSGPLWTHNVHAHVDLGYLF